MTQTSVLRLAGLSIVIGAIVFIVMLLLSTILFPSTNPAAYAKNPLFVIAELLSAVGVALVLLGLPILLVARSEGFGLIGLVGIALLFVTGLMFGIALPLASAVIVPLVPSQAFSSTFGSSPPTGIFVFFILGTVLSVIATALLAYAVFQSRMAPRWVAYLFGASAVLGVIGFFVGGPGGGNVLTALIGNLSPMLGLAAVGWLGYELWTGRRMLSA